MYNMDKEIEEVKIEIIELQELSRAVMKGDSN